MDDQRRRFDAFLRLHAHKATTTDEPVAHLQWHDAAMPLDLPLLQLTRDDVVEALDADGSPLVRWLLQQMATYDCTRERIVGLVFDERTVLSEVLRAPLASRRLEEQRREHERVAG
jgi:hypothetical protein